MHPKVRYELQELENLLSFEGMQKDNDAMLKQSVRFETDRIMQTLALEAFTFQNEEHLQRYIQFHQHGIVRLMDRMKKIFSIEDSLNTPHKKFCYNCLDEILIFLERYFAKYFDLDSKPPEEFISNFRREVTVNHKKIKAALEKRNGNPRLADLLLQLPEKLIEKKSDQKITYRKVAYVSEAQKQLFRLLDCSPETKDLDEELRQIIYYLNYNSVKVLTYHAHYISELLDTAETRTEKIERLSFALKKINQAQVKPGLHYNHRSSSLKDQLNNYITEELEYQGRSQQVSGTHTDNSLDSNLEGFKLKFTASVAQMAYLLKILIESKIILNSNLSQMLNFLVKYVVTKKSESISLGSFRSKFYSIESGTKESVRNMLVSLIKHIDKN